MYTVGKIDRAIFCISGETDNSKLSRHSLIFIRNNTFQICLEIGCIETTFATRLSEVHKKTGAEFVSNGIVGRDLGTKQKVTSQIQPYNTIADEFGISLPLNFGKANC